MSTWWARNRWGVVGLPVALVAALLASSDRVATYWWEPGLQQPQTAEEDFWLDYRDTVEDAEGEHPLEVRIRLDSLSPVTAGWGDAGELVLPDGARAVAVGLSFEADPSMLLSGCSLALRDEDGNRYDYLSGAGGVYQPYSPCVPPGSPGPLPSLGELGDGDSGSDLPDRPREWSVAPVVVLPRGVEITEVLLWWQKPAYATLVVD